jgi:hypothetical protein
LAGRGFNVSFKGLYNLYSQLNLSAKEARNVTKTAMKQTLSKATDCLLYTSDAADEL